MRSALRCGTARPRFDTIPLDCMPDSPDFKSRGDRSARGRRLSQSSKQIVIAKTTICSRQNPSPIQIEVNCIALGLPNDCDNICVYIYI